VVDPATGKGRIVGRRELRRSVPRAGSITPVPGGVGPMTIALLMANTVTAAARGAGRHDLADPFKPA
jgi:methylenetetrahydrofolate dehydrogenase (NADP+)/methenyltetrahydrofolate cyclohydrolase